MKTTIKYFSICLLSAMAMTACSDKFLEDKTNFEKVGEAVYSNFDGANARLNDIYQLCLPSVNSGLSWNNPSTGDDDEAGKSTEEYSKFSVFVDPEKEMTVDGTGGNRVPDFFDNENKVRENVYGRIRNINDFLRGVEKGSLSEAEKDILMGQAYFFRGWCYYNLFKWYGGVPLVTEVLDPSPESFTPRSSAKATYDLIISDLDKAAEMLKAKTANGGWDGNNWGRVTSATALALKGRTMLWWASPIFNRANDESRWTTAYETMKADLEVIQACGHKLFTTGNNTNGSDFALQFLQSGRNPEAVFVTLYNNEVGDGTNTQKNSNWERYIRPANTTGTPGKEASAMLVDMFPMKDGRIPVTANTYKKLANANPSAYSYNENYPFVDRDPRFYRTFAFPGVRWAFDGNPSEKNAIYPTSGNDYELWNYYWSTSVDDDAKIDGDSYAADYLGSSGKGIYVRKRSDDKDVSSSPLYNFVATAPVSGFQYSAAPYIEIRYAEVLLNLAEAACGAKQNEEAAKYLQEVRDRAGVPEYGNLSDQAVCMSAILYERQIEFAYEGKRFDDLRRWLLFDGGAHFAEIPGGAPATWNLTGWGGNTCEWLGFTQLNGKRRDNMQFRILVDTYGYGKSDDVTWDPLLNNGGSRCAALDYRSTASDDLDTQIATLKGWYENNLSRRLTLGDGRDANKVLLYMNFRPQYYIIGLSSRAQNENKGLPQTIGWEDYNNRGTYGSFDPLAE